MILFDIGILIISTIILIVSIGTFIVLLALWSYTDAKEKSSINPVIWMLIVVFGCFPLGWISYFLIGRKNKDNKNVSKYKKAAIIAFILIIPAFIIHNIGLFWFSSANLREGFFLGTGQFYELNQIVDDQSWIISASKANGRMERNFRLNQNELENLSTSVQVYDGKVFLVLSQVGSDVAEPFIISDQLSTQLDIAKLEPGMIRMYVTFLETIDANITIDWGADMNDIFSDH